MQLPHVSFLALFWLISGMRTITAFLLGLRLLMVLLTLVIIYSYASWRPRDRPFPTSLAYRVDRHALTPELASTFLRSRLDDQTRAFLLENRERASALSGRLELLIAHKIKVMLRLLGWTRVDTTAVVGERLFAASREQLDLMLERATPSLPPGPRLLDIGAGRGHVTSLLAAALHITTARDVVAVEQSLVLRRELAERGFRTAERLSDPGVREAAPFGVVGLLNVLDRVDDPLGLLQATAGQLPASGGLLLVASVLPFNGFVRTAYDVRRAPQRPLVLRPTSTHRSVDGGSTQFERGAAAFAGTICDVSNASLLAWTRLPYLQSADVSSSYYSLDHALFVFQARSRDYLHNFIRDPTLISVGLRRALHGTLGAFAGEIFMW